MRRLLGGEALGAADNAFGLTVAATDMAAAVPVVLAATGPKMLEAGGRVADGVLTWMCDETYLAEVVVPRVARGAAQAERDAPPVIAGVLICVSDDAERARTELRPRLAPLGSYDSYQTVLEHGPRSPRAPVDVAAIGTEGEIANNLGRLTSVGASDLVAVVLADPTDPAGSIARARQLLGKLAAQPQSPLPVDAS